MENSGIADAPHWFLMLCVCFSWADSCDSGAATIPGCHKNRWFSRGARTHTHTRPRMLTHVTAGRRRAAEEQAECFEIRRRVMPLQRDRYVTPPHAARTHSPNIVRAAHTHTRTHTDLSVGYCLAAKFLSAVLGWLQACVSSKECVCTRARECV